MSQSQSDIAARKCITPAGRLSFPHIFEMAEDLDGKLKYSCSILMPKDTADLTNLKKVINTAAMEQWGADRSKWPKDLRYPIRDGDEKSDIPGYAGHWYITAKAPKMRPGVVNRHREPITDPQEAYAGVNGILSVIAFAYDKGSNKGVSFNLQNVLILGGGEPFSGRRQAAEDFADVEIPNDGSDDPDAYDAGFGGDEAGFGV